MRVILLSVFFLSSLNLNLYSQNLKRAKKNILELCSIEMYGRGYVNKGDSLAAVFLSDKLEKIGLEKLGESYWQFFELPINTFPDTIFLQIDEKKFVAGADYLISPNSISGKGEGKIIVIDSTWWLEKKVQNELLKQDFENSIIAYPYKDLLKISELPQNLLQKITQAQAFIELYDTKLNGSLASKADSPPTFKMKIEDFPENASFAKYQINAKPIKNYQSQNLIGYIEGTEFPEKYIVFTAHYDHLGMMGKDVYFPGANDNAAGVAMLLEIAYHYKKNPLPYSIVFILFGAEEAGLIGSKYYTENPVFPLENILVLWNLDLVGTGDDGITVVNGAVFQETFDKLVAINQKKNLLPSIKIRGKAANSDHYFFSEKGVESFFIYTLGGIKAYHDIYDIPETLPLTKFSELFKLLILFNEEYKF